MLRTLGHFLPLSEIKSYVAVLSFYIKMIKRRTLQVSSLKHSIKKDMLFCLGQIEIILVGQRGIPLQPLPPPPLATRLVIKLIELHKKWSFPLRISSVNGTNPQFPADLVTSTEEILNGKFHFLCSVENSEVWFWFSWRKEELDHLRALIWNWNWIT